VCQDVKAKVFIKSLIAYLMKAQVSTHSLAMAPAFAFQIAMSYPHYMKQS